MPIIKTLKNGQWTPVHSVTSLATATQSTAGLMSASDKVKLDNVTEYSTTETVVGTWVDGKPIYRRVIQLSASDMPIDTQKDKTLPSLDYDFVTKCEVYGSTGETNSRMRFPIACYGGACYILGGKLYILNKMTSYVQGGYAIIEYTKTTD